MILVHDGVVRPRTLGEALAELGAAPAGTKLLAGGTDLYVQWGQGVPVPERVIDLSRLDELRAITAARGVLSIGALATHARIAASADVRAHVPALAEAAATVGAAQIQNRGTIGGNVANASPAGDTLPVLLATSGSVVVASAARGERAIAADAFWVGYRVTALRTDELVVRIEVPLPGWPAVFRKVGTRRAQAISKVVLCCARERRGATAAPVRVAFGSMAPVPCRVSGVEALLSAGPLDDARIDSGCDALARDLTPIDDVRSTAAYRMHVARAILRRALLALRATSSPRGAAAG